MRKDMCISCIYRYRKRLLHLTANSVWHRSAANLTSFSLCFTSIAIVALRLLRSHYDQTPSPTSTSHSIMPVCVCVCMCMWFPVSIAPQLYDCYQDQFYPYPYILWVNAALIINLSQIFFSIACRQIMQISSVGLKSVMREGGTMPRADLGHWLLLLLLSLSTHNQTAKGVLNVEMRCMHQSQALSACCNYSNFSLH